MLRSLIGYDPDRDPGLGSVSFPKRGELMSLSTLENNGKKVSKRDCYEKGYDPLSTEDVQGARPRKGFEYRDRDKCLEQTHGAIPGASPRRLHREARNRPTFSLMSNDIEGAFPASSVFSSARVVDPNDPQYKLPSFEAVPPPEPRFVRDTFDEGPHVGWGRNGSNDAAAAHMNSGGNGNGNNNGYGNGNGCDESSNVNDDDDDVNNVGPGDGGGSYGANADSNITIASRRGKASYGRRALKVDTRVPSSLRSDGIEGGDAGWRTRKLEKLAVAKAKERQAKESQHAVDHQVDRPLRGSTIRSTTRKTNPLEPVYVIRNRNGDLQEVGGVDGSTPAVRARERKNAPDFSLATRDVNEQGKPARERRQWRNPNFIDDIDGAHPGPAMRPSKKVAVTTQGRSSERALPENTQRVFARARKANIASSATTAPTANDAAAASIRSKQDNIAADSKSGIDGDAAAAPAETTARARGKRRVHGAGTMGVGWWPSDNTESIPKFMEPVSSGEVAVSTRREPDAVDLFAASWAGGHPTMSDATASMASSQARKASQVSVVSSRKSSVRSSRADPVEVAEVRALE